MSESTSTSRSASVDSILGPPGSIMTGPPRKLKAPTGPPMVFNTNIPIVEYDAPIYILEKKRQNKRLKYIEQAMNIKTLLEDCDDELKYLHEVITQTEKRLAEMSQDDIAYPEVNRLAVKFRADFHNVGMKRQRWMARYNQIMSI